VSAVANEDKELKVTDKRIFTPEGELREEYRFLEEKSTTAVGESEPEPEREPELPAAAPAPAGADWEPPGASRDARLELPTTPPQLGGPSFFDLVAMLAEPVALYLGDAPLPDGQSAEDLEMARLHIEMLDVLRQKTAGNLTAQESAVLEDILYRLKVRYVQKRG
jgi:hypothetical protein